MKLIDPQKMASIILVDGRISSHSRFHPIREEM